MPTGISKKHSMIRKQPFHSSIALLCLPRVVGRLRSESQFYDSEVLGPQHNHLVPCDDSTCLPPGQHCRRLCILCCV